MHGLRRLHRLDSSQSLHHPQGSADRFQDLVLDFQYLYYPLYFHRQYFHLGICLIARLAEYRRLDYRRWNQSILNLINQLM